MKLGEILHRHGITYHKLAQAARAARGKGISEATLTRAILYDDPLTNPTRQKIAAALLHLSVPEVEVAAYLDNGI